MKKFTKSVLTQIKKQKIQPKSEYYFWFRNLFLILMGLIFFSLGVIASGIIFHFLNHLEFAEFIWQGPRQLMKLLWFGVPFLWIFLAASLLLACSFLLKEMKKGYKFRFAFLLAIILIPQVVAGALLEQSDLGEKLDQAMANRMSFHQTRKASHEKLWSIPSEGFLGGTIIEIQNNEMLLLDDFSKKRWWISYSVSQKHPRLTLETGKRIKILGEQTSESEFVAEKLLPWRRPGTRKRRGDKKRFPRNDQRRRAPQ